MVVLVVASGITGVLAGWVVAMIIASAAMSYSQGRMQRKVRYWQAATALARAQAKAERLAREAISQDDLPPRPGK
jgi:hypothetical protein